MIETREVAELVGSAYQAALGDTDWASVLESTAHYFAANAVLFNGQLDVGVDRRLGEAHQRGMPHLFVDGRCGAYDGPDLLLIKALARPNRVNAYRSMGADPILRNTELYQDCFRGMIEHAVNMVIEADGNGIAYLSFCRPPEEAPFDFAEIETLTLLSRHFAVAWGIGQRVARESVVLRDQSKSLEIMPDAAVLLASDGSVVQSNARADSVVLEGRLSVEGIGQLTLASKDVFRRAIATMPEGVAIYAATYFENGHHVTASALLMPAPVALAEDSDGLFLLTVRSAREAVGPPEWILANQYGLTGAEARFLRTFLRRPNIGSAARELGLTLETGRTYLKAILKKVGVHTQTELVSAMLSHPLAGQ